MFNREKFDAAFESDGGYFDIDSLIPGSKIDQMLTGLTNRLNDFQNQDSRRPFIHFALIQNPYLMAKCSLYKGEYFIGISIGSMVILDQIFSCMLANGTIFPEIGNSSIEENEIRFFNAEILNSEILMDESPDSIIVPKDLERMNFATQLMYAAAEFLLMHECGHINCGHLGLLSEFSSNPILSESIKVAPADGLKAIDRQTLESDADCFAMTQMLIKNTRLHKEVTDLQAINPYFYKTEDLTCLYTYFAVYTMFRLFGGTVPDSSTFDRLTHPPAGVRQFNLASQINTWYQPKVPKIASEIHARNLGIIAVMVENSMNLISRDLLKPNALISSLSKESMVLTKDMIKNWIQLRPRLLKHAFVNLAAIQPDFGDHPDFFKYANT